MGNQLQNGLCILQQSSTEKYKSTTKKRYSYTMIQRYYDTAIHGAGAGAGAGARAMQTFQGVKILDHIK